MKHADPELARKLSLLSIQIDKGEYIVYKPQKINDGQIEYMHYMEFPSYIPDHGDLPAPRLDDVSYYIRDNYGILISIELFLGSQFCYNIYDLNNQHYISILEYRPLPLFDEFDDALEDAIKFTVDKILPYRDKKETS